MSRTIRRKKVWNKDEFIDCDQDWLDHMSGTNPFPYISFQRRKFNGCTDEQIIKKRRAKYHSDGFYADASNRSKKQFASWWLRNKVNHDLRMAIKDGTEDCLSYNEAGYYRMMNGWWFWWD